MKQEHHQVYKTDQKQFRLLSVSYTHLKYDATILDIGQADIHNTLSLGILFRSEERHSGFIMKELLFKASSLGVTIRFEPIGTCLLYTSMGSLYNRQSEFEECRKDVE